MEARALYESTYRDGQFHEIDHCIKLLTGFRRVSSSVPVFLANQNDLYLFLASPFYDDPSLSTERDMAGFAPIIEIFASGAFFRVVGTNTVELWSTPHSLHNEGICDSKFRREQLIITSTHPSYTGYYRYPDDKWIPFGPIFHLELLNQVMTSTLDSLHQYAHV